MWRNCLVNKKNNNNSNKNMITIATLEDVKALNDLINSAYRGESSKKGWTYEADLLGGIRITEDELSETIKKTDTIILKYTDNQEIIACMMLVEKADKLYLGMLTVSPELQGGGIGKQLLKQAEIIAHEKGLPKIGMTVISARQELIDWYTRHGYADTGEREPFILDYHFGVPKQDLEFIVMEKGIRN
jgi:ribosomal protein S18 acetylase RimI-like enzyme